VNSFQSANIMTGVLLLLLAVLLFFRTRREKRNTQALQCKLEAADNDSARLALLVQQVGLSNERLGRVNFYFGAMVFLWVIAVGISTMALPAIQP
jgi:hypothetical protein